MRVALTHSKGRLVGLEESLRANGFEVVHHPLIALEPIRDADMSTLLECPWWLVTSASSAEALRQIGASFSGRRIGSVGEATAQALRWAGATVDLVGSGTVQQLGTLFLERVNIGPVGLPVGDRALPTLRTMLEGAGLEVRQVEVYRNRVLGWPERAPTPEIIVLASPSAVSALPESVARRARLVALGETTAERAQSLGLQCLTASQPTVTATLETILGVRLEIERKP